MKTYKNLIIDGNNVAIRSHFKMPYLTDGKGNQTGAIFGFLKSLLAYRDQFKPEEIFIAFDGKRAPWRMELCPSYKANRKQSDDKNSFYRQLEDLRDMLQHLPVTVLYDIEFEADDLIADVIRVNHCTRQDTVLVTSDEDFYQLLEKTNIWNPGGRFITEQTLLEERNCTPREYLLAKSITGDSSDNIAGIPGIGEKTALKIVAGLGITHAEAFLFGPNLGLYQKFGKKAKQITEQAIKDVILRNYEMMNLIKPNVIFLGYNRTEKGTFDGAKLLEKLGKFNINSLPEKILDWK